MIEHIKNNWNIINLIFNFFLFTYIYNPLYKSCNVEQKIKNNNKTKIIYKPKIILAFIYFLLLLIIFSYLTFKIILLVVFIIILTILILCDKFLPYFNDIFKKYNKLSLLIFLWKIFQSFFTVIYMLTDPFYTILNKYIKKKLLILKKLFNFISFFEQSYKKNFDEIKKKMNNLENKTETSNISEYLIKSESKNLHNNKEINNNYNEKINMNIDNIINKSTDKSKLNSTDSINLSNNTNSLNLKIKEDLSKKICTINKIFNDSNNEIEDICITENKE